MSTARRRPRRYTELTHRPEDGKPVPLEVGCWVVVLDWTSDIPMWLSQVVAGPHHRHMDDETINDFQTIGNYWQTLDQVWRDESSLTRLDIAATLTEATETLVAIRRGRDPEQYQATILRVHRAACLARRALAAGAPDRAELDALVAIDVTLADTEQAWGEMARVRLPNLARAIAAAGALELARGAPEWAPNVESRPHPALLMNLN